VPQTKEDWPAIEEINAYEAKVRERVRGVYERLEGKWTRRQARVLMMVRFPLHSLSLLSRRCG
jgi:hypothetical protein